MAEVAAGLRLPSLCELGRLGGVGRPLQMLGLRHKNVGDGGNAV
jgi:hypothetical protein